MIISCYLSLVFISPSFFFFFLVKSKGQCILVVTYTFGSQHVAKCLRPCLRYVAPYRHQVVLPGTTHTWMHQLELPWPGFGLFSRLLRKRWSIVKEVILARNACLANSLQFVDCCGVCGNKDFVSFSWFKEISCSSLLIMMYGSWHPNEPIKF